MARFAGHLHMGTFQRKLRISVVYKFFGRPFICRAVASLALRYPAQLELAAMRIGMAGRAFPRCNMVLLFGHMALLAGGLGMPLSDEKYRWILMCILIDLERGKIGSMAYGAVILLKLFIELSAVRVCMTILAGGRCGGKLPHAGLFLGQVTLNAGHGLMPSFQRIGFAMPCDS